MLRSEKFNQALEISFSFGGFSMKRDSFGRTPTFFLADSSVSSGVLFGFGQHGSWGWDPVSQDFVPGFEEMRRFGVGCFVGPSHGWGDAGQTLMRSRKIVSPSAKAEEDRPSSESVQIDLDVIRDADCLPPGIEPLFQGSEQALDSAVLPGAERVRGLFVDTEQPQGEAHQTGVGMRRAQETRFAAGFDHLEQQTQNANRGAILQGFQTQQRSGAVIQDAQTAVARDPCEANVRSIPQTRLRRPCFGLRFRICCRTRNTSAP